MRSSTATRMVPAIELVSPSNSPQTSLCSSCERSAVVRIVTRKFFIAYICLLLFRYLQGYFGECGLRGGYMEVHGIGAEVRALIWGHPRAANRICENGLTFPILRPPSSSCGSLDCRQTLRDESQVRAELYKLSSLSLCSNTIGQLATGIMINPPKPGDPSFETFQKVCTNQGGVPLLENILARLFSGIRVQ